MEIDQENQKIYKIFEEASSEFHDDKSDNGNYRTEKNLINEINYSVEDLERIDIDYDNANISFHLNMNDQDKVAIKEYYIKNNVEYISKSNLSGGTLKLKQGLIPKKLWFSSKLNVDIFVPIKYYGDFRVRLNEGQVYFDSIKNVGIVMLETKNATVRVDSCNINAMSVISKNGAVNVQNSITNRALRIKTKKGSIKLNRIFSDLYQIEQKSGRIRANGISGHGYFNGQNSSMKVSFNEVNGNIIGNVETGSIHFDFDPNYDFNFDISCQNGSISTPEIAEYKRKDDRITQGTIGSNPEYSVKAYIKSGIVNLL
ncbi:DUF4097 family beta strand repeat protein [Lactobacillus sp. S2-2]|uniref:DUF4097 family beta strand repeat-containing protein n=1 Tax=Lactobacillus sp. S2-2 TaxID=2692917 RepID=UPI001F37C2DD|nr:DUF4097 family beta strand repeat-containing protein [Lactobacillus sp. S2-2]MCF6515725.1 DUF4097 family beta strand repeat protein [Lactobacillus sp. S2-2]